MYLLVRSVGKGKWEWTMVDYKYHNPSFVLGTGFESTIDRAKACAIAALALS